MSAVMLVTISLNCYCRVRLDFEDKDFIVGLMTNA